MPQRQNPGKWKWLITGALVLSALATASLAQYGAKPSGERVIQLADPGTKAVALFFVASDCPVSDRTFPEMKRLREEFAARGVRVWFVYPNSTENPADVEKHQREFDPGGGVLLDPAGDLVKLSGAQVTPEVSILVPQKAGEWKPVYTGRVDDRFVHIGLERPQAKEHFAEAALQAVLSGKLAPRATGTPVGCGIVRAGVLR